MNPFALDEAVDFDEVVTCLPVVEEVIQGFREERAFRTARDAMLALPIVESPMEESLFVEAATSLSRGAASGLWDDSFEMRVDETRTRVGRK